MVLYLFGIIDQWVKLREKLCEYDLVIIRYFHKAILGHKIFKFQTNQQVKNMKKTNLVHDCNQIKKNKKECFKHM